MGLKAKCDYCKKNIDVSATRCPYCQGEFTPEQVAARKKETNKAAGIGCVVLLVLVALITMCSGRPTDDAATDDFGSATYGAKDREQPAEAAEPAIPSPEEAVMNALTPQQQNARRNAQQYIDMTGFSREGLIEQLSSDAGSGYARADAIAAVDSMDIDWNEQAARSAKQYLDMTGFSCNGLIEQLSSSAGSGYTKSQAAYGAKQAGAC